MSGYDDGDRVILSEPLILQHFQHFFHGGIEEGARSLEAAAGKRIHVILAVVLKLIQVVKDEALGSPPLIRRFFVLFASLKGFVIAFLHCNHEVHLESTLSLVNDAIKM